VAIALVVSAAISPQTLQGWQVIIALHAALLPVAAYVDRITAKSNRRLASIALLYITISFSSLLLIGSGNNIFRPGPVPDEVRNQHPQLIPLFR
jgi:hypothetical protein